MLATSFTSQQTKKERKRGNTPSQLHKVIPNFRTSAIDLKTRKIIKCILRKSKTSDPKEDPSNPMEVLVHQHYHSKQNHLPHISTTSFILEATPDSLGYAMNCDAIFLYLVVGRQGYGLFIPMLPYFHRRKLVGELAR